MGVGECLVFLYPATERWVISVAALPRLPTLRCSRSLSVVEMHSHGHDTKTNCITWSGPQMTKTHIYRKPGGGALTEQGWHRWVWVCFVCVFVKLFLTIYGNWYHLQIIIKSVKNERSVRRSRVKEILCLLTNCLGHSFIILINTDIYEGQN